MQSEQDDAWHSEESLHSGSSQYSSDEESDGASGPPNKAYEGPDHSDWPPWQALVPSQWSENDVHFDHVYHDIASERLANINLRACERQAGVYLLGMMYVVLRVQHDPQAWGAPPTERENERWGVYRTFTPRPLYVGMSKNLARRITDHLLGKTHISSRIVAATMHPHLVTARTAVDADRNSIPEIWGPPPDVRDLPNGCIVHALPAVTWLVLRDDRKAAQYERKCIRFFPPNMLYWNKERLARVNARQAELAREQRIMVEKRERLRAALPDFTDEQLDRVIAASSGLSPASEPAPAERRSSRRVRARRRRQ